MRIYRAIIAFCACSAFAQPAPMRFDYLTSDNGLSSNKVTAICRDGNGYMWFGTELGLNRYDGYQIKLFQNNGNQPGAISSNGINCIYEDRGRNLWIGTTNGLNLYNPAAESFTTYQNDSTDTHSINGNTINGILEDKKGNLWVLSGGNCLNKWIPQARHFIRYPFQKDPGNIYIPPIRMIAADSKGYFWIVSYTRGIIRFNPENGNSNVYDDPSVDFGNNFTKSLCIDQQDKIWIGSNGGGFYSFDPAAKKFKHFEMQGNGIGTNAGMVRDVTQEDDRHVLIAVDQGGINRFDKKSGKFEYIMYGEGNEEELNSNGIWCLYKDKEGILWVGTSGGGVNYYNPKKSKFRLFRNQKNNPKSLSNNIANCFCEDSKGLIWVGTDGGGLNAYNPKTGNFKTYLHNPADPRSISGNVIRCIAEDRDHDLWIGTWDAGLNRFDRTTGNFQHYLPDRTNPSGVTSKTTWYLIVDHRGKIWLGNWGTGLEVFDKQKGVTGRFNAEPGNPNLLRDNTIWFLYEDSARNIWICSNDGLYLYNSRTTALTEYKNFIDHSIRILYEDKSGNFWAGSNGKGLYLFKRDGSIVKTYDKTDGLPDNTIHAIVEDNQGNLWISTNYGISRFNPKTLKFRNYSKNDGLQGNQFNWQSFMKTRDGEIYFGGYRGFNSFFPDSVKDNDYIPPVHITDFQIFNKPVPLGIPGSPLKNAIGETREMSLSWRQSVFSFGFTAVNFTYPEKNQYAYIMEGFEAEWNYTDASRRYVTYTNLDPGKYTFHVKASNNDGIWNQEGASITIRITPPFWKTWWFKTILVFMLVSGVFGFVEIRMGAMRKRRKELEILVEQRTHEIKEKNELLEQSNTELDQSNRELDQSNKELERAREMLSNNNCELQQLNVRLENSNSELEQFAYVASHDLQEPLRMVSSYTSLLEKRNREKLDADSKEFIAYVVDGTKRMQQLIIDLLGYSRVTTQGKTLEPTDMEKIVNQALKNLEVAISECGAKVTHDPLPVVQGDPVQLERLFQNLAGNAIKYRGERTPEVHVSAKEGEGGWVFSVADNGIGIDPKYHDRIFGIFQRLHTREKYSGTGIGLAVCKKIVERHGGTIRVESEEGRGSTFIFTLPCSGRV